MRLTTTTLIYIFATIYITGVLAPPPRNVVEMKESIKIEDAKIDDARINAQEELLQKEKQTEDKLPVKEKSSEETPKPVVVKLNTGKVLSVDDLQPPDHLDAVKLERDGMINKEYNKEVFLGNHEEIEDDLEEVAESKLKDIFIKVDSDADGKMCLSEIESWIIDKTQEHFDEALEENEHVFKHMDPDGDGLVDWKEYYVHFLLAKGYQLEKANKHVVDYDEIELDYEEREALIKYKFKWTDADINPMDNKLSKEEFLAFRHPEQSDQALNNMLRTIIEALDKNDDGILSEDEFVSLPLGDIDDEEQKKLDKSWQVERSNEFKNQIDKDKNGQVTKEELKKYLDPRNPEQANSDAKNLVEIMDSDSDQCISWDEVLDHTDEFLQSKCYLARIKEQWQKNNNVAPA